MHPCKDNTYTSPQRSTPVLPSLRFYAKLMHIFVTEGIKASKAYTGEDWVLASLRVFKALEESGAKFSIDGMENITAMEGPAIFIGNHMSTLETFILPALIQSRKDVTFVVKESLVHYPFFKHVLLSRDPILVGRTNPREDLKAVLDGGLKRLQNGRSIIIFPQSTRSVELQKQHFNSIGVKLARRAKVPVVPVALKTDAWSAGSLIKDFGPIISSKPIHFNFGTPIEISSANGKEEHEHIYTFIESRLKQWGQ